RSSPSPRPDSRTRTWSRSRSRSPGRSRSRSASRRHLFLLPLLVAGSLERLRELRAALLDDLAADEDVHEVGLDVVEDALVVRDHERAHLRADELLHAAGEAVVQVARCELTRDLQPVHLREELLAELGNRDRIVDALVARLA